MNAKLPYSYGEIPLQLQRRYLHQKFQRIWELDFLRGICVLLMVLDHLTMLIVVFSYGWFGNNWYYMGKGDAFSRFCYEWMGSEEWETAHNVVLFVFFSISGISCTLSRSNLKRGAQLGLIATVYSIITIFGEEVLGISGITVMFGVLNFLAFCILLYALTEFLCRGDSRSISVCSVGIIGIVLILYFCYTPPPTTPKFFGIVFPTEDFYGNPSPFYRQNEFSPGDLFTIIPHAAYYFAGVAIAPFLYGDRRSLLPRLNGKWNKPVCFIGRHALIIYILHLVLLAGFLALITYVFITPGELML